MTTVKEMKAILDGQGIICTPEALKKINDLHDENVQLKHLVGEFLAEIAELEGSDAKYLGYQQRRLVNRLQQALEKLNLKK